MSRAKELLKELQESGKYKSFHFTVYGNYGRPDACGISIRAWDGEGQVSWHTGESHPMNSTYEKDFDKFNQALAAFKKFMREDLARYKAANAATLASITEKATTIYNDAVKESPEEKPSE